MWVGVCASTPGRAGFVARGVCVWVGACVRVCALPHTHTHSTRAVFMRHALARARAQCDARVYARAHARSRARAHTRRAHTTALLHHAAALLPARAIALYAIASALPSPAQARPSVSSAPSLSRFLIHPLIISLVHSHQQALFLACLLFSRVLLWRPPSLFVQLPALGPRSLAADCLWSGASFAPALGDSASSLPFPVSSWPPPLSYRPFTLFPLPAHHLAFSPACFLSLPPFCSPSLVSFAAPQRPRPYRRAFFASWSLWQAFALPLSFCYTPAVSFSALI